MVSGGYYHTFVKSVQKDQGKLAAAAPHVVQVGQNEKSQSGRYWAAFLLGHVIPFGGSVGGFSTQESLLARTFWKDPEVPAFDIQVPIISEPAEHAAVFSAACALPVSIPFSVMVSWFFPKFFSLSKPAFVRLGSTNRDQSINASEVIKKKIAWHPFLDELNSYTALVKAWNSYSLTVNFEEFRHMRGSRPDQAYVGFGRLYPYKGWTLVEAVMAPFHFGSLLSVGQEVLNLQDIHKAFRGTLRALRVIGKREEEIGKLFIHEGNQEMMARIIGEIDPQPEMSQG